MNAKEPRIMVVLDNQSDSGKVVERVIRKCFRRTMLAYPTSAETIQAIIDGTYGRLPPRAVLLRFPQLELDPWDSGEPEWCISGENFYLTFSRRPLDLTIEVEALIILVALFLKRIVTIVDDFIPKSPESVVVVGRWETPKSQHREPSRQPAKTVGSVR